MTTEDRVGFTGSAELFCGVFAYCIRQAVAASAATLFDADESGGNELGQSPIETVASVIPSNRSGGINGERPAKHRQAP
ncbi:hypothetical protein A9W96_10995 [Mycobacterium sp. 1245852.3]|nr:hypothetical protein A9W96_10995 [Mycobacterium sp. 1245852.3]